MRWSRRARSTVLLGGALLLLLLIGFNGAIGSASSLGKVNQVAAPAQKMVYLGAWVGERKNIPGDVDEFERAIGKKLSIIHRYSHNPPYLQGEHFNVEWANWVRSRGAIPMVSWEPRLNSYAGYTLKTAAQGSRDEYVRLWARELKEWGHPLFFRPMWEQNSHWFAWAASKEPDITYFKQFWRRMVNIFREVGANNVTFVWSPHTAAAWVTPPMDTYPGDEYVDWVGMDGYPFRAGRGDFYQTFKPDYDELSSKIDKPLMIAETSLTYLGDRDKARVIDDALNYQIPVVLPKVKALVWFDEKYCLDVNYSILMGTGPLSREAFRQAVSSNYYASNNFGQLDISPIPIPELAHPNPPAPAPTLPPLAEFSGNLLTNGGFEVDTPPKPNSSDILPAGWTQTGYYIPNAISLDWVGARTGSQALRHASFHGPTYGLHQDVTVGAGQSYSFLGYVKVSGSWGWHNFTIQLQPLKADNSVIKTIDLASFRLPTDGWQKVRATNILMPAGTAKLRVNMNCIAIKGIIHVDDFILVPSHIPLPEDGAPPPSPEATPTATVTPTGQQQTDPMATLTPTPTSTATPTTTATPTPLPNAGDGSNLLVNPSFDLPLDQGWVVPSWVKHLVNLDPSAAFDGVGQGLLLNSAGNYYEVQQDVPISPNSRYQLKGSLLLSELKSGAVKVELIPLNRYNGAVGNPAVLTSTSLAQVWQGFQLEVATPSNATKLRVRFTSDRMRGSAGVDGLQLVKIP